MAEKHQGPKRRNPLHDHPLMKKGGKHEKTRKAQRRSQKVKDGKLPD